MLQKTKKKLSYLFVLCLSFAATVLAVQKDEDLFSVKLAKADTPYVQSSYYSQGSYYGQSGYGDDDGDGDGDDDDDDDDDDDGGGDDDDDGGFS